MHRSEIFMYIVAVVNFTKSVISSATGDHRMAMSISVPNLMHIIFIDDRDMA